jgi:hypothetical protein
LDGAKEVVIARDASRGDGLKLLEFVEEAFDKMAIAAVERAESRNAFSDMIPWQSLSEDARATYEKRFKLEINPIKLIAIYEAALREGRRVGNC